MSEQPERLSDRQVDYITSGGEVAPYLYAALAREVQGRRALDAQRRCSTCVHGFVNPNHPLAEVGVRCDWLQGAIHFGADHFCAKWEAKP